MFPWDLAVFLEQLAPVLGAIFAPILFGQPQTTLTERAGTRLHKEKGSSSCRTPGEIVCLNSTCTISGQGAGPCRYSLTLSLVQVLPPIPGRRLCCFGNRESATLFLCSTAWRTAAARSPQRPTQRISPAGGARSGTRAATGYRRWRSSLPDASSSAPCDARAPCAASER